MQRYEIREYREITRGNKSKKYSDRSPSKLYGVWDNKADNWVVNAKGIGKSKALKMLRALRAVSVTDEIKAFWKK